MPLANVALQRDPKSTAPSKLADTNEQLPPRLPNVKAGSDRASLSLRSVSPQPATQRQTSFTFQPRTPVIMGEATYRGNLPVDGLVSGQLLASGSALTVKQRPRNGRNGSTPELDGEICFKDVLRINGHIAGKVLSEKGTLIIDASAQADAYIEVGVAMINGTVNGDIVARERVELGLAAVINGNISTPKLSIKPGAVFHGDCCMLKNGASLQK